MCVLLKDQGLPVFPSVGEEVTGINAVHPTWFLTFKKRLEYTWGWTDQLFSKPRGCIHHAVVVASGYVQQCSAWLSLSEYNQHHFYFSEMMVYWAQKDNLLFLVEFFVLGLVRVLESSAQISDQQMQLLSLTLKNILLLKFTSHLLRGVPRDV